MNSDTPYNMTLLQQTVCSAVEDLIYPKIVAQLALTSLNQCYKNQTESDYYHLPKFLMLIWNNINDECIS